MSHIYIYFLTKLFSELLSELLSELSELLSDLENRNLIQVYKCIQIS